MKQNRMFSLLGRGEAEQGVLSSRRVKIRTGCSLFQGGVMAEQGVLSSREG